jgi:hypothetical protein
MAHKTSHALWSHIKGACKSDCVGQHMIYLLLKVT